MTLPPCPCCGKTTPLHLIQPIGIQSETLILYNCQCQSTRAIPINTCTPDLIEKAIYAHNGTARTGTTQSEKRKERI